MPHTDNGHIPPSSPPPPRDDAPADASAAPLVRVENVRKTYRLGKVKVPVLRGVSLTVGRGECVAILGASGSGKSTLLHLVGGLDRPDRVKAGDGSGGPGRIFFDGRPLSDRSHRELDRFRTRDVGFVFQFYHLLPELNVLENVAIAGMIRRGFAGYLGARGEVRRRAADLLGAFGLGHRLTHRPAQLSGGERQRVAIARALINEPRLLLADEPTGNLDRETGERILNALFGLRDRHPLTILMVTHDPEVAARADRIVRIADGHIEPQPGGLAPDRRPSPAVADA